NSAEATSLHSPTDPEGWSPPTPKTTRPVLHSIVRCNRYFPLRPGTISSMAVRYTNVRCCRFTSAVKKTEHCSDTSSAAFLSNAPFVRLASPPVWKPPSSAPAMLSPVPLTRPARLLSRTRDCSPPPHSTPFG